MMLASLALLAAAAWPAQAEPLPQVLSEADAQTYARIFEVQLHGDWKTADRLIGRLHDKLLMGHVLYQRYMHPTAYRSSYPELHKWMKAYGDHPLAEKVFALAKKRRLKTGWKPLPRPRIAKLTIPSGLSLPGVRAAAQADENDSPRTAHDRAMLRLVRRNVLRDWMTVTEDMLDGPKGKTMTPAAMAEARATLARGHLSQGRFGRALEQGDLARKGPGGGKRAGAFYAGLALWAMNRRGEAHFRFAAAAATAPDHIGQMGGAADYWEARAALAAGRYDAVVPALKRAAQFSYDMYGLLAARQLAGRGDFDWSPPALTTAQIRALMANPAVRRAVALVEAGEIARADGELRRLSRGVDRRGAAVLLALSAEIDAPATAYRIARIRLNSMGERYDRALFPLPAWPIDEAQPVGRALLMAVARRESGFDTRARSGRGARGLMQLMPRTADYIARKSGQRPPGRAALYDAEISLQLGQSYLAYLMDKVEPKGSLLHVLAAYNAGPGKVREWQKRFGESEDPLLFVELMGSRQTRLFVRDVLAAYWIYRDRLGRPTPTLGQMAEGHWPFYSPPRQAGAAVATGQGAGLAN